jgi:hypothetical protein
MGKKQKIFSPEIIINLILKWFQSSWLELIGQIWQVGTQVKQWLTPSGLYKVLEYEITLELLDIEGKKAKVHKRQKVRYLQDNIIAYQDQSWGDGEILKNYRCSPGKAVDQYRTGHKTCTLISLREEKNKGEIDEFLIQWDWANGFLSTTGYWAAKINHRTNKVIVNVIFPELRPPTRWWISTSNYKQFSLLSSDTLFRLPDGRWSIKWELKNPKLYRNYLLKWEW